MKKTQLCKKWLVIGCVRLYVSFFLTYLKVEIGYGYRVIETGYGPVPNGIMLLITHLQGGPKK